MKRNLFLVPIIFVVSLGFSTPVLAGSEVDPSVAPIATAVSTEQPFFNDGNDLTESAGSSSLVILVLIALGIVGFGMGQVLIRKPQPPRRRNSFPPNEE